MKKIVVFILYCYQKTISPDHGVMRIFYPHGYCKWYPTCSEYAVSAITQVGVVRGIFATVKRILRCQPWSKGGIDIFSEKK